MLKLLLTLTPHLLYIYIIFISASIFIPWSTKLMFPLGFYVSIVQCENTVVSCKVISVCCCRVDGLQQTGAGPW